MQAKSMVAKAQGSLSASLDRARARCVMLEGSDFLFFERIDASPSISADTVRGLSSLGSLASEDSVVLMGEDDRVEALLGLAQFDDTSIKDFSKIRTIGLVPQLGHRLGTWTPQQKIRDGFWSVRLPADDSSDEATCRLIQLLILNPWVGHRKVHRRLLVPSKAKTSSPDPGLAMWECQLIVSDEFHRSDPGVHWRAWLSEEANADKWRELGHVGLTAVPIHRNPAVTEVDNSVVVEKVDTATEALDAVLQTLTSPVDDSINWDNLPDPRFIAPPPAYDPVRRAIEIREKLQQTVRFIDSATWAKWRGIRSNPSAALGKHKQKGRIFAVRSGKRDLYPAFQFAANTGEPLSIMGKILKIVPKAAQGWPLLSWFEAQNVLLHDRKPSEVLATDPDAVLTAAVRFHSRED